MNLIRVSPDGTATAAAGAMMFANGMATADGGAALVVAETRSEPGRLTAFAVGAEERPARANRSCACRALGAPSAPKPLAAADRPRLYSNGGIEERLRDDRGYSPCRESTETT